MHAPLPDTSAPPTPTLPGSYSMPAPLPPFSQPAGVRRVFNRNFFDRKDPAVCLGLELQPIALHNVYTVEDRSVLPRVRAELYDRLLDKLRSGSLDEIDHLLVAYQDGRLIGREPAREYIVITFETQRRTLITVLARFHVRGDHLYVGVDAYVLGATHWWAIVRRAVFSGVGLGIGAVAQGGALSALSNGDVGVLQLAVAVGGLALVSVLPWVRVIRIFYYERRLELALRQAYPRPVSVRSFNLDDVFVTLKSVLPTILYAARDVFEHNGMPVRTLDESIANINNVQTINNFGTAVQAQGQFNASVRTRIMKAG
jgi:hypothetical protein